MPHVKYIVTEIHKNILNGNSEAKRKTFLQRNMKCDYTPSSSISLAICFALESAFFRILLPQNQMNTNIGK